MFNFFKKKKSDKNQNENPRINLSFVDKLEKVNYFEFTDKLTIDLSINRVIKFSKKVIKFIA